MKLRDVNHVLFRVNAILVMAISMLAIIFACERSNADPGIGQKTPGIIKVMVIDTGIGKHKNLLPNVQYEKTPDYEVSHPHGTHVAGIIMYGNNLDTKIPTYRGIVKVPRVCAQVNIHSCKFYNPSLSDSGASKAIDCIKRATKEKFDVINYSGGGTEYTQDEYEAAKQFVKSGGLIIAAAGNEHQDISKAPYYPAAFALTIKKKFPIKRSVASDKITYIEKNLFEPLKNVVAVSALGKDKKIRLPTSNFYRGIAKAKGEMVYSTFPDDSYGIMTGTSQAAPAYLHMLLMKKCFQLQGEKK